MSGESSWAPVAVMAAVGVVMLANVLLIAIVACSAAAAAREHRESCKRHAGHAATAATTARQHAALAHQAATDAEASVEGASIMPCRCEADRTTTVEIGGEG